MMQPFGSDRLGRDGTADGPAIETHGLGKRFGETVALRDLDLRVARGEIVGFLGPNGAGKTTTMRMLAALLKPSAGTIRIGGVDVLQQPLAARRVVGFVPETPFLYEKLTGREFLSFTAGLFGVKDPSSQIERLLRLFELEERGDDLVEGYSRGMRQKLGLAGVLLHEPEVLLLDEPTNALDPRSARTVKDLLLGLRDRGRAVLLSTHVLEIAEQLCDRVAIIDAGALIASGTLAELRQRTGAGDASLEDVFLRLTGGNEERELARYLAG
ncbi:MAG TPA: ABC transporter ATP-binding protein [Dehalococcoidia bacterium]|nr:ABC transporter ATP-binding protein [Dehalococcoidia bacterium]